jgi:hypothetical protein
LRPDEDPSPEDVERFGSETVPCRGCGTEIYDEAEWCHNCGRAQSAAGDADDGEGGPDAGIPPWAMLTAGLLVAAILIVVFGLL